jgi:two-component system OmpR family response regulator
MERRTVLVVEDNPELRSELKAALELAGLTAESVSDGAAALARLSEAAYDAVCLDVILPDLSGYDVCEQLRQSNRHAATVVVMMSARAYPADFANALEAGADAFVAKPFDLRSLVDTIQRAPKRVASEAVA